MKKKINFKIIWYSLLTILTIFLITSIVLGQKHFFKMAEKDKRRKQDLNTIYYYLTNNYYSKNQSYPEEINPETLSLNIKTLKDPDGNLINTSESDYNYTSYDCLYNKCQHFELWAKMDLEADYKKRK